MTSFEFMMPFLIIALTLASGAALFLALRAEYRLLCRKQIKLANYREKNYLFYITRDIPVAVVAGALAAILAVFTLIVLFNPVLRIYAIPMLLLAAVNGGVVYFSLSRRKYVRDIRIFDAYYVQVADLLSNKEQTLYNMEVCRKRVKELHGQLSGTLSSFNKNLTHPISAQFLSDLFAPIGKMVQEYMEEIDRFSLQIEHDFDSALALFLQNEEQPELKVVPLRDFDDATVDDLLAEIKSSYGTQIAGMVIQQVESGAVAGAVALGNIMTLLHGIGVKVNSETLTRFMRAAAVFKDRSALASVLYENQQIPTVMVREVMIPENWEWAFAPGMAAAYNNRQLTAILADLLAANRVKMSYLLLSQMDAAHAEVLDEALKTEKSRVGGGELNEAAKQTQAFALILGNEYAVGNTGSIFENIALMLYDRRAELDLSEEEEARVVEIVRNEAYMDARRELGILYTRVVRTWKPLCDSATRVLLQYIVNPPAGATIWSPERLAAVLGEYRFTLSFGEIAALRMLVGGWMLCHADEAVRAAVLQEFVSVPAVVPCSGTASKDEMTQMGKQMLCHLLEKDRVHLRPLMYRTESTRQALDRVRVFCEKGD